MNILMKIPISPMANSSKSPESFFKFNIAIGIFFTFPGNIGYLSILKIEMLSIEDLPKT